MIKRQQGFNLIEILIAVVILAVGLLGIAGLQLTGVRANQGSYYRSQASAILMDMAERIHANRGAAAGGGYAGFVSGACAAPAATCATENGTAAQNCTAAQMAAYDRFIVVCGNNAGGGQRTDRLTDLLPGGIIQVTCLNAAGAAVAGAACVAGFRHQITVIWQERTQSSTTNAGEFNVQQQQVTTTITP